MSTIITRQGKGIPLTNAEVDANFTNLNQDKSEKSANLSDLTDIPQARINLGLGNVSNTADADKPVSTATQAILDTKSTVGHTHDTLYETKNTNIQTHIAAQDNPHGVTKVQVGLGSVDNTADLNKPISTATQAALNDKENLANKGVANGYAGLDSAGKVPATQLPSYVDDVLEFANLVGFPATGEPGKIYVALDTNKTYRWSGSAYIYITSGAVDSVAGKTGVVVLAKADVGLGNVDNTSDADKPISTAQQAALDLKAPSASPSLTGTLTHSGDIVLSGSGKRIIGDFSNATIANRVMFQTSTVNGNTVVSTVPNGPSTVSGFRAYGSDNLVNGISGDLLASTARGEVQLTSNAYGEGAYPPMTFYTGGSERMRIDTSGNVGIGNTAPGYRLDVTADDTTADLGYAMRLRSNATAQAATLQFTDNGVSVQNGYIAVTDAGLMNLDGSSVIGFRTNSTERMRIDSSGNVLVTGSGGLGYGTGAGGAVTQATSKSTTVALNKPTGQILMSNSALAAGATATFLLNNTLIMWDDVVVVSIVAATVPTQGAYQVWATNGNQGCYISLKNNSGVSLSDSLAIQFAIIKGTTA